MSVVKAGLRRFASLTIMAAGVVGAMVIGCGATAAVAAPVVTDDFATLPPGSRPIALAVADDGSVFTANSGSDSVTKLRPDGTRDPAFGGALPTGALPFTLAYGDGAVFVTSVVLNKLWMLDATSGEIDSSFDTMLGRVLDGRHPTAVTTDHAGHVFVLASGDQRVVEVSRAGSVLAEYPLDASAETQSLSFGDDGVLYAANSGDGTVSRIVFDRLGHGTVETAWAALSPGVRPQGLAFDHHGFVYAVSSAHETVSKIDQRLPSGVNVIAEYRLPGSFPFGIASDALGNVYTSNIGDNTVSMFPVDGSPAATIATLSGSPDAEAITADAHGGLFTANFGSDGVSHIELAPRLTSPLPTAAGTVGVPVSFTMTASGLDPISFSAAGTLPFGLVLDPTSGVVSGTPTSTGTFRFDLVATNAIGISGPQRVTISIAPAEGSTGCWYWLEPCGV
ncbi:hypothetical protein BH09ACT6_BH09ACT6_25330 [soil metagenome]